MTSVLKPMWQSGFPVSGQGNCVAMVNLKLINVFCDKLSGGNFYNFSSDGILSSTLKPVLGYLCETRHISTLGGTEMCRFPFVYQGRTYASCSFENNTMLNNNGAPWCATEVYLKVLGDSYNFNKEKFIN